MVLSERDTDDLRSDVMKEKKDEASAVRDEQSESEGKAITSGGSTRLNQKELGGSGRKGGNKKKRERPASRLYTGPGPVVLASMLFRDTPTHCIICCLQPTQTERWLLAAAAKA